MAVQSHTTRFKPGTIGFDHNARTEQLRAWNANEILQVAARRLREIAQSDTPQLAENHAFNDAFAAVVHATMVLLPHVTEAVQYLPNGTNHREALVLDALRAIAAKVNLH